MATINGTTTTDYWTFKLEVTEGTPNITNNTSPVTVDVYIGRHTVGSYMYAPYINCTVSCTGVSNQSFVYTDAKQTNIGTGEFYKIGSVTFSAVPHNDDGSKTVTIGASFTNTIKPSSGSASGSVTLTIIARASQPSLITWPETTNNIGSFGDKISIHMNRKSSSFTHTVRYEFGSTKATIATSVGTGCEWTIPTSLMNQLPSSTSGSGRIYVDTYNGSTLVGTKYTGFTATVPSSVKPSVSYSWSDTTGYVTTYGKPVSGLSKIKITVSATQAYSSPISAYTIVAGGKSYNSSSTTFDYVTTSGSVSVSASATDKRNRSNSYSGSISGFTYNRPSITKLDVRRCDSDGTANNRGAYVKATFSASVTSLGSKNTATYVLRYKKSTDSSWTVAALSGLNNNYTVTDYTTSAFAADVNSSYDVKITVSDRHYSSEFSKSASTGFTLMNFHSSGTGIGIGKVAEKQYVVDVDMDIDINNHVFYGVHGLLDTRYDNQPPSYYLETYNRGVIWEFKQLGAMDFTSPASVYGPVQTIIPWQDKSGGWPRQIAYENETQWIRIATSETSWGAWRHAGLSAYPVGSIYLAYNHTSPASIFGGTWTRIENYFLWAGGATATIGGTGGEQTHTLTVNEMPSHSHNVRHNITSSSGGSVAYLYSTGGIEQIYPTSGRNVFATTYTGGGAAHNNMPPYIQISAWRRTA